MVGTPPRSFDWNLDDGEREHGPVRVTLLDETLRDGLRSPSAHPPTLAEKVALLYRMDALASIATANVGYPGAGARARRETEALCWEITRGLAVASALAAARAGVSRLHGTALGVGGARRHPAIEDLLLSAHALGWARPNLAALPTYLDAVAMALHLSKSPRRASVSLGAPEAGGAMAGNEPDLDVAAM